MGSRGAGGLIYKITTEADVMKLVAAEEPKEASGGASLLFSPGTFSGVLESQGDPYLFGKTWTTDAIFCEARSKIQARRAEGAIVVEMETAALFAVGAFRDVLVAQLLYAGDNVGGESWDHREWSAQRSIRKSLFFLACEACCEASP